MGFTDEEFETTLKEIDSPLLDDYEFFVETHNIKVYRKYSEVSGLYQYKVLGEINVEPETCADVYQDIQYRKKWDKYAADLKHIKDGEIEYIYWEVAFPWPMSHRDYVYRRQKKVFDRDGGKGWVILGRSTTEGDKSAIGEIPEKSGVIRVDDFIQGLAITSNGQGGTKAFMHYYDNPKGSIPTMLINWAASTGVPDFLSKMETACNKYKEYKAAQ